MALNNTQSNARTLATAARTAALADFAAENPRGSQSLALLTPSRVPGPYIDSHLPDRELVQAYRENNGAIRATRLG